MKRRNLLKSLIALPFVGLTALIPKPKPPRIFGPTRIGFQDIKVTVKLRREQVWELGRRSKHIKFSGPYHVMQASNLKFYNPLAAVEI